ncbi:MAG: deoxyribonuclease IV [Muribaculaceae bacterium]|nr:deoxyribonuclease IV [Muribaculaceae bacterium]
MKYLGAHIEIEGNLSEIPAAAASIGAKAFSFCPGDARRWSLPTYDDSAVADFIAACASFGFAPAQILPHASLLLNLCSPDKRKLSLSRMSLCDQMNLCARLGLTMLNFHPGATLKEMSETDAVALVAESINYALERTGGVTAVIENTAGQGSNIGYDFAHIAEIIARVEDKSRVGVCIDTCHAWAAGYDMSTEEGYKRTWDEFDRLIGMKYLRGMHINDAVRPLGSRIDRHASIRNGTIGNEFFAMLMSDPNIDGIPMILETPDPSLWKAEIEWLESLSA